MDSHGLSKILGNHNKNKKTENIKLLMEWIKCLEEKVLQLEDNFEKYANNTTENNVKELEKLFKLHEELKTDIENKFINFEERFSNILKAIEEIIANLQSTVNQIDDKFSTVESICESMDNDFVDRLANVERKIRSEINSNNTEVQGSVDKLGTDFKIVSGEMSQLSGDIEALADAFKSINGQMSQMKSNWQQNEIQVKKMPKNLLSARNALRKVWRNLLNYRKRRIIF
jgi:methyl-accepting chemotaxis protein